MTHIIPGLIAYALFTVLFYNVGYYHKELFALLRKSVR